MAQDSKPLQLAIAGLSHGHVGWVFESSRKGDIQIVGIAEADRELAEQYAEEHNIPKSLLFPNLRELLDKITPEAVAAFGPTYDHLAVVETCAPIEIDVMVEKPLAVNLEQAQKMKMLANRHGIHLITNYETTWYASNHKAHDLLVGDGAIGAARKIVVRDGHRGPKKIGVGPEFLEWLTDPKLNGGGALPDFGCYGANLITWLLEGERPISVTAITHQLQAENNPLVEDEAVILLKYKTCVGVIEASWNWPIGRKDMEVYGVTGALLSDNSMHLRQRTPIGYDDFSERPYHLSKRPVPYNDPFLYLRALVRGEIEMAPFDPSSLENNMLVVRILEAAKKSAETGQAVKLKE